MARNLSSATSTSPSVLRPELQIHTSHLRDTLKYKTILDQGVIDFTITACLDLTACFAHNSRLRTSIHIFLLIHEKEKTPNV